MQCKQELFEHSMAFVHTSHFLLSGLIKKYYRYIWIMDAAAGVAQTAAMADASSTHFHSSLKMRWCRNITVCTQSMSNENRTTSAIIATYLRRYTQRSQ